MVKLIYEDKINIYKERKNGVLELLYPKKYGVRRDKKYYLGNLIDRCGYNILRTCKT